MMDDAQLAQGLIDGIGGRLLTDACCFVFANSHWDVGEEMADQFLRGCHHLIAYHSQATATLLQCVDSLDDTVIGTGGV